jgi:hypothetical protein
MTAHQFADEDPMIPAHRDGLTRLRAHAFLAILSGLALRLLFALLYPAPSGDSETYLKLAGNWANHHVYGLWINGQLAPTDLRMPGYPAFLAAVAMLFGRSVRAIMLSQVALDLGTCFLTVAISVVLAPVNARRRVAIAGLWLAATCPFIANYSAVVLTEILVTFLATAALVCFVMGLRRETIKFSYHGHRRVITGRMLSFLGAFLTGLATLVRPEMPLLLAVAGVLFMLRWWRSLGLRKVVLSGVAMAGAFLLPLAPWAARNFIILHEWQVLAPRYATVPGEYAPVGYYAWTKTWLVRYRDVYLTVWRIGEERMNIDDLSPAVFDSPGERARIASLFDKYNDCPTLDISPDVDHEFAKIAHERTQRHPLRTYILVPFGRALTIWFTPRTELLPIDGKIWPISEHWKDSRGNLLTTAGLGVLNYFYIALALSGIWVAWSSGSANLQSFETPNLWGIGLLLAYLLVRTVFLTSVEAPEPRYVVTCFSAVLALGAQVWAYGRE